MSRHRSRVRQACPTPDAWRPPDGFAVRLAAGTRTSENGRLLFGGSPPRLLRLGPDAARLSAPGGFTVTDHRSAVLARKLLDTGIACPQPPRGRRTAAIVIPVRDRRGMLDRLLSTLRTDPETGRIEIVVVDDGSRDQDAIRESAARHQARVIRHEHCRGPAAARNTGMRAVTAEFVAFCDSDVVPERGWLGPLLAQFADPTVALAAPRIVALRKRAHGAVEAYEQQGSPLDLGARQAPIVPMTKVAYVPSAAVVLRKAAAPGGFDEHMRVAEDVDLCLRLHESGWRMRYRPEARVAHDHRVDLLSWAGRRAFYGSGAAALSELHPGMVPPMHVSAWALAAFGMAATGRVAGIVGAVGISGVVTFRLARRMPDADRPVAAASMLTMGGLYSAATQLLTCAERHHWPLALALMSMSGRARRVLPIVSLVRTIARYHRSTPPIPIGRFAALSRLDDFAYGAGLWWGAIRHRTTAPLIPRISVPEPSTGPRLARGRWPRRRTVA